MDALQALDEKTGPGASGWVWMTYRRWLREDLEVLDGEGRSAAVELGKGDPGGAG